MRICKTCRFPALIAGDYGGAAPIPCSSCGGQLGEWFHRETDRGKEADRVWFKWKRSKKWQRGKPPPMPDDDAGAGGG